MFLKELTFLKQLFHSNVYLIKVTLLKIKVFIGIDDSLGNQNWFFYWQSCENTLFERLFLSVNNKPIYFTICLSFGSQMYMHYVFRVYCNECR